MENNRFEYCCGADELGNLYDITAASLKRFLALQRTNRQETIKDPDNSIFSLEDFPGAYIATTIPSQRGAIRALRANKFKEVFTFTNPGTGNRVTLWALKFVK